MVFKEKPQEQPGPLVLEGRRETFQASRLQTKGEAAKLKGPVLNGARESQKVLFPKRPDRFRAPTAFEGKHRLVAIVGFLVPWTHGFVSDIKYGTDTPQSVFTLSVPLNQPQK